MSSLANAPRPWRIVHSEASCGWGGQEHRVLAEMAGFQQRGAQVWVMAEERSEILKRSREAGIGAKAVQFKKTRMIWDAFRLARWLRREKIDVLNTHSSRDGWTLGLAGRLARVPLLIRSRHIDVDYATPSVSRHAFTTFADHVLTTSAKITTRFQELFHLSSDHITTLPTGIDIQRFHPNGPKADLGLDASQAGGPVVGMVSVLRSWKGHATFFEAARILKDAGRRVQFVVVGGGAPVANYETIARQHGAEGLIRFAGHREDVPEVLRALDLLVIPSIKHEGVPQIGLQALASQTAVVGSACGGIPEIIRDGESGRIFPIGDAQALAARIAEALDQPEATHEMVLKGRQQVERHHSLDHMLDQLDELYRSYVCA